MAPSRHAWLRDTDWAAIADGSATSPLCAAIGAEAAAETRAHEECAAAAAAALGALDVAVAEEEDEADAFDGFLGAGAAAPGTSERAGPRAKYKHG